MKRLSDIHSEYLSNYESSVDSKEMKYLLTNGFVVLKRTKKYWKSLGIDLEKVKKKIEFEIKKFEKKPGSFRKIDHTYRYENGANRLSNLLAKDNIFYPFITIPDILYCVNKVIGSDFRLSSFGMREPLKGSGHQGLHIDWQQRKKSNSPFFQVTGFVLLDKMTKDNGAPRIIPKSHISLRHISSTSGFEHKRKPDEHKLLEKEDRIKSKHIEGNIGDIIILNVNSFHGGSKNINGKRRRVLVVDYRICSQRSQVDHFEAIPKCKHSDFTEYQQILLDLKEKRVFEKLKRWAYENRNNKIISNLIKLKGLLRL